MKIIHSYWSKPYITAVREGYGGWPDKGYHFMSQALSCLKYKEFYKTELITDIEGHKVLIELLKLPYDDVNIVLDGINEYSADVWALGKYPNVSTHAYTFQNPVKFIDPDGKEGIVISGQPGSHKNKTHFLVNGLDRAIKALDKTKAKSEKVTWIIYNGGTKDYGFTDDLIKEYTNKAKKHGIEVKVVDYVNDKDGGDSRKNDKISSFYYIGHATPGDLEVGYEKSSEDYLEVSDFESEAFSSGTWVNLVGDCRTAVDGNVLFEDSSVDQFTKILDKKSTINGSDVRVQYDGGVRTDAQLLKANKGNIVTKKGEKE